MIFSLVVMTGLEKYCITSAYLQWLCHSGERSVARGPLVYFSCQIYYNYTKYLDNIYYYFQFNVLLQEQTDLGPSN